MLLAAGEVVQTGGHIDVFDFFILAFTIIIAVGVIRSLTAKQKNIVAIGFGLISLGLFVFMDVIMVKTWIG